jgi:carbonic anhydrase/acetyltransferase-like protein (isoleucine patch superfamily)
MPMFSFEGRAPSVHPDAWIAPTATLVGDVTVEAGASVWYGAVLRADFGPIVVRSGANIQDCSVIHGAGPVEIGPGATVAHLCVVHGATVGASALIGNGATVQDGARVGDRAMVAAGTLVPPNTVVEPGTLYRGSAGSSAGALTDSAAFWVDNNEAAYRELARRHAAGVAAVGD